MEGLSNRSGGLPGRRAPWGEPAAAPVTTSVVAAGEQSVQIVSAGDTFDLLGSSPHGLGSVEASARLQRAGANELPRPRERPVWLRFLAQFTDLFAVVLLVASATTFLAYLLQHPRDIGTAQLAIAILCVVVLNAAIGFLQEYSAERTAQALQAMVPNICRVLRDGLRQEIPGAALVPGDLVLLEAGDAVPADGRLVEAHSFAVNNAPLTGESAPVSRRAEPTGLDVPILDARNPVFMATTVAAGSGKAVVVTTGVATLSSAGSSA